MSPRGGHVKTRTHRKEAVPWEDRQRQKRCDYKERRRRPEAGRWAWDRAVLETTGERPCQHLDFRPQPLCCFRHLAWSLDTAALQS